MESQRSPHHRIRKQNCLIGTRNRKLEKLNRQQIQRMWRLERKILQIRSPKQIIRRKKNRLRKQSNHARFRSWKITIIIRTKRPINQRIKPKIIPKPIDHIIIRNLNHSINPNRKRLRRILKKIFRRSKQLETKNLRTLKQIKRIQIHRNRTNRLKRRSRKITKRKSRTWRTKQTITIPLRFQKRLRRKSRWFNRTNRFIIRWNRSLKT